MECELPNRCRNKQCGNNHVPKNVQKNNVNKYTKSIEKCKTHIDNVTGFRPALNEGGKTLNNTIYPR